MIKRYIQVYYFLFKYAAKTGNLKNICKDTIH